MGPSLARAELRSGRCELRPLMPAGARWLRARFAVCSLAAVTIGLVLACVSTANATAAATVNGATKSVLPYTNPLREVHGLKPRRIDMGVDYRGRGQILALGAGTVIKARNDDPGWPGGGWVMYRLSEGLFAGKYVYAAENITVSVRAGQRVKAGQPIATLHPAFPHLETGWAAGKGDKTLADVDHHRCPCGDPGGWSTIEGRNFNRLLGVLDAPSGYLQPHPPHQHMPPGWPILP